MLHSARSYTGKPIYVPYFYHVLAAKTKRNIILPKSDRAGAGLKQSIIEDYSPHISNRA